MATKQQLLETVIKEIGYVEKPVNKTKYGRHFGYKSAQWCGLFVDWCFDKNNMNEPTCAYTPNGAKGYADKKKYFTHGVPRSMDVVFYDFPNDNISRISHTGFVVAYLKNHNGEPCVLAIEGNTSGNDSGDQRNGGEVAVKIRPMRFVKGWGRPKFDNAPEPTDLINKVKRMAGVAYKEKPIAPKPTANKEPNVYLIKQGDTLWDIANKHNVSLSALIKKNKLKGSIIHAGQKLIIPKSGVINKLKTKLRRNKNG